MVILVNLEEKLKTIAVPDMPKLEVVLASWIDTDTRSFFECQVLPLIQIPTTYTSEGLVCPNLNGQGNAAEADQNKGD